MYDWIFGITSALAEASEAVVENGEAAGEPSAAAALVTSLLPMLLIVVVFYFLLIRPQRKKDKKVKEMLNNLKTGDRICTIGGIYGTIKGIRDDNIILTVGEQDVPVVVARWAIRNVEAVSIENDGEILA
jgi:preprotein translocase subunit YajC